MKKLLIAFAIFCGFYIESNIIYISYGLFETYLRINHNTNFKFQTREIVHTKKWNTECLIIDRYHDNDLQNCYLLHFTEDLKNGYMTIRIYKEKDLKK